jgi:hypothetical protein
MGDEAGNLGPYELARRFIDVANRSPRINLIVCATSNPERFRAHDPQMRERWKTPYILEPFSGKRLETLLAYLDLLLPFRQESGLALFEVRQKNRQIVEGPARFIYDRTKGVLGEIIKLVVVSSQMAIRDNQPYLTIDYLRLGAKSLGMRSARLRRVNGLNSLLLPILNDHPSLAENLSLAILSVSNNNSYRSLKFSSTMFTLGRNK